MSKQLLFTFFGLLSFQLGAQNLVPNPSFEDTLYCPPWLGDNLNGVMGWQNPTTASPDHFHACHSGSVGVPQNSFGFQDARTGQSYVGWHTSDFASTDYREYVQIQLSEPLVAENHYEVKFYVSRADSATKACNNIGAHLSTTQISSSNNQYLAYQPQVSCNPDSLISDPNGWTEVTDTLVSTGGEQFLTIGVFSDNLNTDWITVPGGSFSEAFYYLDDVSVELVGTSGLTVLKKPQFELEMYPCPADQYLYVDYKFEIYEIDVFCATGSFLGEKVILQDSSVIQLSEFENGVYFIRFLTEQGEINKKIIINHN